MKRIITFILVFSVVSHAHAQKKEEKQISVALTKDEIEQHKGDFKKHVSSLRTKVNLAPSWAISWGAKRQGYDDYSVKCIPVSYTFFALKSNEMVTILEAVGTKDEHVIYLNDVLKQHSGSKHCKNKLARILHEKHVNAVTLPNGVSVDDVVANPSKYCSLLKQNKIDLSQYKEIVSLNLFAQFYQEKVVKVLR